jgi:hypothetical protein
MPSLGSFQPLRGSFSAREELLAGRLEGDLILQFQTPGTSPPGSMTEKAAFQQHLHQPWPIFWTRSDNARLVGKMHHWRNPQDRICSEAVYGLTKRRRLREDDLLAQMIVPQAKFLPGAWTTLSSNWNDSNNYYHWMLDGLTRLAVRDYLPEETKILLPPQIPRFAKETLNLLGLESHSEATSYPCVHPERFYFCSPSAMTGVWNPFGYRWLRESFTPYFSKPDSGPPIFLTRRGNSRIPDNLETIEQFFDSHGFELIDCAAISVEEQIRRVSAAPAIAGLHGAAMTNILWAQKNIPVMEIFQSDYLNGCYEQIALEGNLDYAHVTNFEKKLPPGVKDWCMKSLHKIHTPALG